MKILTAALYIIIVVTLLRVLELVSFLDPGNLLFGLARDYWQVAHWATLVYTAVIGYILWRFRERNWIIWCSYAYILSYIAGVIGSYVFYWDMSTHFLLYGFLLDLPNIAGGLAWLFVKARPIAPYYSILGVTYLFFMGLSLAFAYLYQETRYIPFLYVIEMVGVVVPIPTLFLIARAKRYFRENEALEAEVRALG
jgi:hypothetical protein